MTNPYNEYLKSIYPSEELNKTIILPYVNQLLPIIRPNIETYESLIQINSIPLSTKFINELIFGKTIFIRGEPVTYQELQDIDSRIRITSRFRNRGNEINVVVSGFTIPNEIKYRIIEDYDRAGYVYTYFGFLIKTDVKVMIYMKRRGINLEGSEEYPVEPIKQNYEIATSILSMKIYNDVLERFKITYPSDVFREIYREEIRQRNQFNPRGTTLEVINGLGWSKKDIVNAIINTGLVTKDSNYKMPINRILDITELFPARDRLKWNPIGFNGSPKLTYRRRPIISRTFYSTYYMPKLYYEIIYRKIFSTLYYIDWKQVCRLNLMSYSDLEIVAKTLNILINSRDSPQGLCNVIENYASSRREFQQVLIKEVPQVARALVYQPGGPLSYSQVQSQFAVSSRPQVFNLSEEQKKKITESISNVCRRNKPISEVERKAYIYDVLLIAYELGIIDQFLPQLQTITPEMACRILNYYSSVIFQR